MYCVYIGTNEPSSHHAFTSKVDESEYKGLKIIFKAKNDGLISYIMRIIKK